MSTEVVVGEARDCTFMQPGPRSSKAALFPVDNGDEVTATLQYHVLRFGPRTYRIDDHGDEHRFTWSPERGLEMVEILRDGQVIYSGAEWPDPYPISASEHDWLWYFQPPHQESRPRRAQCTRCHAWLDEPPRSNVTKESP